jgi:autotransporter adhesin
VAGSNDAINGDQLAANTTAITNLNNLVTGSQVSPVQYSNPDTPTLPNGGTLTQDVTLAGVNLQAPVTLHNVAGGAVTATSTDAVNGQQLYAVQAVASNSLQYDRDAAGARTNTVTLSGGDSAAPVTLANVAAGTVAAGSTQAVNGEQLYATNQLAEQAAALGANSVQYDAGATSVTLGGGVAGGPVALHNVATGSAATDAVNVAQLQSGMQNAVAQANSYADARIDSALSAVNFDLGRVRREIGAGTAAALAASGLPQPSDPGKTMVAVGGGTYRGQSAVAFGASTFLSDGHSIFRLGATYDSRSCVGANMGFSYQF